MDYKKNINQLIDKYWAGTTSLEEEKWLRKNVPASNMGQTGGQEGQGPLADYFNMLDQAGQIESKGTFEDLMLAIDRQADQPKIAPVIDLYAKRRILYRRISSVAAVLLVSVASFFLMRSNPGSEGTYAMNASELKWAQLEQNYDSPEQAYAEVKQALLLVSNKINKTANDAAGKLSKAEPYTDLFK